MAGDDLVVVVALVVSVAALTVLLVAAGRRWFARLAHGFLVSVLLGLAGLGLGIAVVLGVWAYGETREALVNRIVAEMGHIAAIQQQEIKEDLDAIQAHLRFFAERLADDAQRHPAAVRERLSVLQAFDPRYLQVSLMDGDGRILVTSSVSGELEPPNRVAVAHTLEGKTFVSDIYHSPVFKRWVIFVSAPVKGRDGAVTGAVSARFDMQEDLKGFVSVTRFGATGFTAITNGDGRLIGHPDEKRLTGSIVHYPVVREALQGRTSSAVTVNDAGREMLMVARPFTSPASLPGRPWVLLAETTTAEALAPVRALRGQFAVAALVAGLVSLIVAALLARSVTRPLAGVLDAVQKIRGGDLTARTSVDGHDEIGRLGVAVNEMAQGLQDRDRIKEIFGRYVTTQVSQELLSKEITLGGERRRVTLLFSDIRNFTSMSEAMTPEENITFLNEYFSEMVDAVFEQHGVLDKFMGDGMLVSFGTLDDTAEHERRAVMTALRMKARLGKINAERAIHDTPPIAIGIGIHTDEVIVGNIGSRKRLEYTVIGDGVNTCSRVEGLNKEFGTTILITQNTYDVVREHFECRPMPEAPLKGKTKVPRVFEVVSARARAAH
jgi:class 3 adenylate cyclase